MRNTIDVIGEDAYLDSIIDRTISGEVYDDTITKLGLTAFGSCILLNKVIFPNVTIVDEAAFRWCDALAYADFGSVKELRNGAFESCPLQTLILRNATVCTLRTTTVFKGTPIINGTGYIYVPAALVDSYKTATNWSSYADQIRAIEDYTVDGTTTGELDETKI